KKTKSSVDMLRVLEIPKNDYGIPTTKSSNRYIPYKSAQYRGKRYIYMEGDSSGDEKYAFMSDTTDITSSESEYEELDINDIYVPHAPKYKTLIEVVLEPSKRDTQNDIPTSDIQNDIQNDMPTNKLTDIEWNTLKDEFISNMLQNTQPNDLPKDNISANTPKNTNNTTMSHYNVDNNTHPTLSHDTLDQKPFIMSIHDRNLLSGEEYNYDMINNSGNNDLYSAENDLYSDVDSTSGKHGSYSDKNDPTSRNRDSYSGTKDSTSDNSGPTSATKDPYSGTDLINDSLNSGNQPIDIYDEILKRKENELFGTNHVKHTSTHNFAKPTNSDPIMNQLDLFHKWLDRHRAMCEKLKNDNERLAKLKEEWNKDNDGGNIPNGNRTLNTDVSIQINMNNPKPINIVDSNPDNSSMDKPTMDDMEDDIYYDVNDEKPSVDDIPMDHNKVDVPKKVHVEMKILNNTSNGSLEQEFPISDLWNI
ncbi:erythrocyte membrane protein 1, EMP1, exon 2, partial [Plasmodium reichenowi]